MPLPEEVYRFVQVGLEKVHVSKNLFFEPKSNNEHLLKIRIFLFLDFYGKKNYCSPYINIARKNIFGYCLASLRPILTSKHFILCSSGASKS